VTTGRSGSKSLANILNQHPLCYCVHEEHRVLIKLAAERCHGQIDDEELLFYLANMFPHRVGFRLYGESHQRLSFLIPLLAQLGTHTRFVWLIRDGRDVVASIYRRGWYGDWAHGDTPAVSVPPIVAWSAYRIQGDLSGDVSSAAWRGMSSFEKCCWYWAYTNRVVAADLEKLDSDSWISVRLEELADGLDDILRFLDLPYYPLRVLHLNRDRQDPNQPLDWSEDQRAAFEHWCGAEMDRWYPEWRGDELTPQTGQKRSTGHLYKDLPRAMASHARWLVGKLAGRAGPGSPVS
jgi:hypothetical protein